MRKLYSESKKIGEVEIKNRFVRSATGERIASEDGRVTDELIEFYKVLAEGGVGLIITGVTYVHANGKSIPNQLAIDKDDLIPGLRNLTDVVHKYGENCKIAIQLHHSGRQSMILESPPAPSVVIEPTFNVIPREMTIQDIEDTVEAFAKAARRAKEAGFDVIQLHAAHGYLLSQFLSPYTNKRADGYGGSTENRIKIIEDIYKRSVDMVGKDFPILIKMNVDDFLEGGIKLDESMKIAQKFSEMGFAAIETSSCMWEVILRTKKELGWHPVFNPEARVDINSKEKEAYNLSYAKEIKKVIKVPLILVGGIRSLDVIEKILNEGWADFIGLCRPLIREPDLPNKWLKGIGKITCECISCNGCTASLLSGSIRCIQKE